MSEIHAEAILNSYVAKQKSPSVNYSIFTIDKVLFSYQDGFADIATSLKVKAITTYNVFSVTKTFTALAVLQLASQQKLQLDRPVIAYLPEFPYGDIITINHLLSHTGGLPNPIPLRWIHLAEEHFSFMPELFYEEILAKYHHPKVKPGKKMRYSNIGYLIFGELISKVSGMKFEAYVNKNIIQRLGLAPSDLSFTIEEKELHATGYQKRWALFSILLGFFLDKNKFVGTAVGPWLPFKHHYVDGATYGGLIGNSGSFVKYVQALLKGGDPLLESDYFKLLFDEQLLQNGKGSGVCMSWFKGNLNGKPYFCHAGGGGGYYCELRLYPEIGVGSVLFLNRSGFRDERLLDTLDCAFFK